MGLALKCQRRGTESSCGFETCRLELVFFLVLLFLTAMGKNKIERMSFACLVCFERFVWVFEDVDLAWFIIGLKQQSLAVENGKRAIDKSTFWIEYRGKRKVSALYYYLISLILFNTLLDFHQIPFIEVPTFQVFHSLLSFQKQV